MPFGLDLKSLVIGMLIAWFALPYVVGLFNKPSAVQ